MTCPLRSHSHNCNQNLIKLENVSLLSLTFNQFIDSVFTLVYRNMDNLSVNFTSYVNFKCACEHYNETRHKFSYHYLSNRQSICRPNCLSFSEAMEEKKIVVHTDMSGFFTANNVLKTTSYESMRCAVLNQILARKNTDVVMMLDKKPYSIHGHVMRNYSEFFARRLLTGSVITLPIDKLKESTVQMLYDWMLSDGVDCPRSELLDFLETAHCFYIPRLVDTVYQCLCDQNLFSGLDSIYTYFEAKRKHQMAITEMLMTNILKFFLLLVCSDEYRDMDVKCVCSLLSSDKLVVQSEMEVFFAALLWMFVDYKERKRYIPKLMECIRFMLLPPRFLLNLAKHLHELPEELADELCPQLHKTMLYQQEENMQFLKLEELVLRGRSWIKDPECPYIKHEHQQDINHMDFVSYVDQLNCAQSFLARIVHYQPKFK